MSGLSFNLVNLGLYLKSHNVSFFFVCRLALYVYEYLLHVGAQKAAQTFLNEVSLQKQIKQTTKKSDQTLVHIFTDKMGEKYHIR